MTQVISESVDRRLTVFEYLELKLHLLVCSWCARYLKHLNLLRSALRLPISPDQSIAEPTLFLSTEARDRIAKALDRHDVSSTSE
jgi:hypothetical protein